MVRAGSKALTYIFMFTLLSCGLTESVCKHYELSDGFSYGLPIVINNTTEHDMYVVLYPITYPFTQLEKTSSEQFALPKKQSTLVKTYLGKIVNMKNLYMRLEVWKLDKDNKHSFLDEDPYLVATFHNPTFENIPEQYLFFAEYDIK